MPYLLYDNARMTYDNKGNKVSFYFNRIEQHLGFENCVSIYQKPTPLKKGFDVSCLVFAKLFDSYSGEEKKFIRQLKMTYFRIVDAKIFTAEELFNIRVAINAFFKEYRLWNFILNGTAIRCALFDEHYHREGFILALKQRGIKAIELQHGLIAHEDIFYVFPKQVQKVAARAIFPDKILTYGEYWSDILYTGSEFRPEQIDILGLYQEINTYADPEKVKELNEFLNGEAFVLVTTQTFLHQSFVNYVDWLADDLKAKSSLVKIVVKLHPSERPEEYKALLKHANVLVFNCNTEYLLSQCKWHISCYSTTLFDATKYGCDNFSIPIESCMDYIEAFVKGRISKLIEPGKNPVLNPYEIEESVEGLRADIFEDFDKHKHKLQEL